jgi:hypothetical protein
MYQNRNQSFVEKEQTQLPKRRVNCTSKDTGQHNTGMKANSSLSQRLFRHDPNDGM